MAWGNAAFATFLILCPTSFFLGLIFSLFPYDYPILWTRPSTSSPTSLTPDPFLTLETHLRLLHASPAIIPRILHIVIATGLLGFLMKLYRPSESNMLFDGASLVLYLCGIVIYVTNIVKGLRVVSAGTYGAQELVEGETAMGMKAAEGVEGAVDPGIGREDSLRVLSASNTILALVLMGVLVLQAGQWYAERKEGQEVERLRKVEREKGAGGGGKGAAAQRAGGTKKKV